MASCDPPRDFGVVNDAARQPQWSNITLDIAGGVLNIAHEGQLY